MGRRRWLARMWWVLALLLLAWGVRDDIGRGARVHLVATGVLLTTLVQPPLSRRRRWLEYGAFGLFQLSMVLAVRGIAEQGRGRVIGVLIAWAVLDAVLVIGYRRYLRHLRTEARRSAANAPVVAS